MGCVRQCTALFTSTPPTRSKPAVDHGITATAGVVSSAALVMVGALAVFALMPCGVPKVAFCLQIGDFSESAPNFGTPQAQSACK
jgi:hypothetical protein